MNAFEDRRPRIWLGLGYAPHRKTVDFEAIALNMEHCIRADNDGEQPTMRPIESNARPWRIKHDLISMKA